MRNYGYYLTKLNRTQMHGFFLRHIYAQCQSSSVVGMFLSVKHTCLPFTSRTCTCHDCMGHHLLQPYPEICQIRINGDVSPLSLPIILIKFYANLAVI